MVCAIVAAESFKDRVVPSKDQTRLREHEPKDLFVKLFTWKLSPVDFGIVWLGLGSAADALSFTTQKLSAN